ncbi:hypothetical protein [Adhaeribacter radiodurans]|uniref:DinB family protein n=1 Tax=Adhaeribacter radiodurans TaxID=2745197 RepID=A0A7L7LEE2_9BACT|nr:hypothetical protein [Adhaeribacter radiodurans]QMU31226.1 hypothetical protein HUW48_25770 [Adhaeribacter radiodurans]
MVSDQTNETNTILRHLLATIAYRLTKCIINVETDFLRFNSGSGARKPVEILYHMASVLSFCLAEIEEKEVIRPVALPEEQETGRFFNLLQATDNALTKNKVELDKALQLIQGPLADMLTHVGQLALLRRYFNKPIEAEDFMEAKIKMGVLGLEKQEAATNL